MIDNEYNLILILDNIAIHLVEVESVHMKGTTHTIVPWRG